MPRPPLHPGKVLLGELLERDWTLSQLASDLTIDRELLRDILEQHADVTPEQCIAIARLTGTSEQFWLDMHAHYAASQPAAEPADNPEPIASTTP